MKHPIQWVLFGGGACMVAAILSILFGFIFNLPLLEAAAKWLWLAAVLIAFTPLFLFFGISIYEFTKKKWGNRRG
jgi:fumarate reductase subunit D